jgi:hypothetical protein
MQLAAARRHSMDLDRGIEQLPTSNPISTQHTWKTEGEQDEGHLTNRKE